MSFTLPRPSFIPRERIERTIESQLRAAGLYPNELKPVVDVEAFIERHLQVKLDQHANLDSSILGVTSFYRANRPTIQINADLTHAADETETTWVKGRWRATLAHEACHVIFHGPEFENAFQQLAFQLEGGELDLSHAHHCLKRDLHVTKHIDAREIQANIGMAALLMPGDVFMSVAVPVLQAVRRRTGTDIEGSPYYREALAEIGHTFQVSRESVRIRVQTLSLIERANQRKLSI